jgi:hypothetical protein
MVYSARKIEKSPSKWQTTFKFIGGLLGLSFFGLFGFYRLGPDVQPVGVEMLCPRCDSGEAARPSSTWKEEVQGYLTRLGVMLQA